MADDRLFHKRLGHSQKVNLLTAEEEIVWRTYIQEADDFGVMPWKAAKILAGHNRFEGLTLRVLQRMLDRVHDVGLVGLFEHQGQAFGYQTDWQDYQKLRYVLTTSNPRIPAELLAACTLATQWLHTLWPGRKGKLKTPFPAETWTPPEWPESPGIFPESSRNFPGDFPEVSGLRAHARAGGYALTGKETGEGMILGGAGGTGSAVLDPQPSEDLDRAERAGRFVERYRELFPQFRKGAHYVGRPTMDFQEALLLVDTWDDARLDQLVEAFLTTDQPFCRNGSGTIAQFRARASWCDSVLREKGL